MEIFPMLLTSLMSWDKKPRCQRKGCEDGPKQYIHVIIERQG